MKVVDDIESNAYSLPGGFIHVYGGLILSADNEAELAAALAHETAHVAARHFTKLCSKKQISKWSSLILAGPAGFLFWRTAVPLLLLRSARRADIEADLVGLEYQYASGYDPGEFVELWKSLEDADKKEESFRHRISDSHPLASVHVSRMNNSIARYLPSRTEDVVDTSEFHEIKDRVATLMGVQHLRSEPSAAQARTNR